MNSVLTVTRKEMRQLIGSRATLFTGIGMAIFFGVMYSLRIGQEGGLPIEASLGSLLFFLTTTLGVFMGYTFTGQVFLREKMDGVIETLLCSPATLREVWLGKTLAVTALADVLAVACALITALVAGYRNGAVTLPPAAIVVHVFLVVPMVIGCFVGALGYAQLLLGMKENRIIGLALFIPVFAALYGLGYAGTGTFVASWLQVGLLGSAAVVVLSVLVLLSQKLSKERIVTTLPD
ncbi:ABC transporter permease [Chloroflexota bacterium]